MTPEGSRLQVKAAIDAGGAREAHEAELRERAQRSCAPGGLLSPAETGAKYPSSDHERPLPQAASAHRAASETRSAVVLRGDRIDVRRRRDRIRPLAAERLRSAPSLANLSPITHGRRLEGLRRRRLADRGDPLRQDPAADRQLEDPAGPEGRDGGDRGQELLQPRRHRPLGDRPRRLGGPDRRRQAGGGRLDDHPAARPQPLHRGPPGHAEAQDHRGAPGQRRGGPALEGLDPDRVPEHRLLRDQRGRDRDRRRGGRRDLLLQARPRSDPDRGGDDRRPAAGAVPVQPAPQPARGARPAKRGARRRWSSRERSARPNTRTPSARIWASTRDRSTAGSASPTSSTSSSRSCRTATG